MKVWLDDERPAPPGWVRAHSVFEVFDAILNGATEVSLDHDLGLNHYTGYDVLVWIEQRAANGHAPPRIRIHTANPPARKRMEAAVASIQRMSE